MSNERRFSLDELKQMASHAPDPDIREAAQGAVVELSMLQARREAQDEQMRHATRGGTVQRAAKQAAS